MLLLFVLRRTYFRFDLRTIECERAEKSVKNHIENSIIVFSRTQMVYIYIK